MKLIEPRICQFAYQNIIATNRKKKENKERKKSVHLYRFFSPSHKLSFYEKAPIGINDSKNCNLDKAWYMETVIFLSVNMLPIIACAFTRVGHALHLIHSWWNSKLFIKYNYTVAKEAFPQSSAVDCLPPFTMQSLMQSKSHRHTHSFYLCYTSTFSVEYNTYCMVRSHM